MSNFKVGYAEVNINPPLGAGVSGYYIPRFGKGFLDDLMSEVMILSCNGKKIALISVDNCGVDKCIVEKVKVGITEKTGIPGENIFLAATHTHTGALLVPTSAFDADEEVIAKYAEFVINRIVDGAVMAVNDLKDANKLYVGQEIKLP